MDNATHLGLEEFLANILHDAQCKQDKSEKNKVKTEIISPTCHCRTGLKVVRHTMGFWWFSEEASRTNSTGVDGTKLVYYKDEPIWSLHYSGSIVVKEGFDMDYFWDFRRRAQSFQGSAFQPVGPLTFKDDEAGFEYQCSTLGEMDEFHGLERIFQDKKAIFLMKFFGRALV
jgi:hypothetical protein